MPWIHTFGPGRTSPTENDRSLLGGKGAGLAEMSRLGLPVPSGFTIDTQACAQVLKDGQWPSDLKQSIDGAVAGLEADTKRSFGDSENPLLVSVRSGAAVSMPGMMDTVLNLGLNDQTVLVLAERWGARFAWDTYRRFVQMYGDIVLGVHFTRFSRATDTFLAGRSADDLDADGLKALTQVLKQTVADLGRPFPQEPLEQLYGAIDAVFRSYNSHRARYYRKSNAIPDDAGTAVNVQQMVFGNMDGVSGTGVCFTRNPKTGDNTIFGEWLPNAQGEDVVAGIRTPFPLAGTQDTALSTCHPELFAKLERLGRTLEAHFGDMQDIEFTIETGELFVLQTRSGKRSAQAAVQIVVDLVEAGVLTREDGLRRIDPSSLEMVMRPVISPDAKKKVIATGLDAAPGAACGVVVFESSDCQEHYERDIPTILVRLETSPEDIQGMTIAAGVLTARGGQTSHAAVVARGMGKPCVVGCTEIQVDYSRELFYAGDSVIRKGDWITIDGATGEVMEGKVEMLSPESDSGAMSKLLTWADTVARMEVRANADTGPDAARARELGAVGIGLCRTEHMFFQPESLRAIRRMILADDPKSRQRALNEILPLQRNMFLELFEVMDGLPVTIRLLDPPLHEFLPAPDEDLAETATALGVRTEALRARLTQLRESNPMLGHRGVRVGLTSPEVYRTQVRAIFEAACELTRRGVVVLPEVMIPLVCMASELSAMRALVVETAEAVIQEYGAGPEYLVGTMIELPRAALTAGKIAEHADFFSFGTNDLTQMTYGFSRDDMGKFFPDYQRAGVLTHSPLSVFDVEGVGELVRIGVERGRATSPGLKVGICGEHGGEPAGVQFFNSLGLDYVSCSPYRVPVARLAAALAQLDG